MFVAMPDNRHARASSAPPASHTSSMPPSSRSGPYPARSAPPPAPSSASSVSSVSVRASGSIAPPPTRSSFPAARAGEEEILPFSQDRAHVLPASQFRSTWIVSSLQSLRERGHFERYLAGLAAHKAEILECVAGTWLPLRVAHAHYAACDALRLATEEQLAMGRAVGGRAQGSILQTAAKAARGAGVTPWTILPQFDRLWRRGANGGVIAVTKTGPKEARVEIVGCALFDVDYFRNAFRGVLLGIGDLFCRTPYVHDVGRRIPGEAMFQLQWV